MFNQCSYVASAFIGISFSLLEPNYSRGMHMLRSVRDWLLKICYTEDPHTLREMDSHTGDHRILVIKVCHTDGPHTPGKTVSHTWGPHFHQEIPILLGKWGPRGPILGGPHFHMTPE